MKAKQDHFALFGLPCRFALDDTELERRYHELQARVHPDKHAHLDDTERRQTMQRATQANEAYQTLKAPLKRGRYLLELTGHDLGVEHNTAMPVEFLVEQMELREAVAKARGTGAGGELEDMLDKLRREMRGQYQTLQQLLDERSDYEAAAELVRRLMFQEKLLNEIDDALASMDA